MRVVRNCHHILLPLYVGSVVVAIDNRNKQLRGTFILLLCCLWAESSSTKMCISYEQKSIAKNDSAFAVGFGCANNCYIASSYDVLDRIAT